MDMSLSNLSAENPLLILVLVFVVVLLFISLALRKRYAQLKDDVEKNILRIRDQEDEIAKLEDDLRDYVMGGRSLREWKMVKQQMDELLGLPRLGETKDAYILQIHLSMTKKDALRMTGSKDGVTLTISPKDELPVQVFYATPGRINPSNIKVTYKGNSLEMVMEKEKEEAKK